METNNETKKRVHNLIIVDESGSMGIIQRETLSGLNETIATCRKMQEQFPEMEQRVTLLTFESNNFKVLYDNVPATEAKQLEEGDYVPGGCTPLYDAIGKGIARINAVAKNGDNVLVTILTDGEENSSREYNLEMVNNLINKQKELGWTFTLIGTDNLNVRGMAHSMAIDNSLSWTEDSEGTKAMWAKERRCRAKHMSILASMSFADECSVNKNYFDDEDSDNV